MRRYTPALIAVVLVSACGEGSPTDIEPGMALVEVNLAAAPSLSTLVVEVTATDITTPLSFNVTLANGTASDTLTIPAGSDRTITVRGYDPSNIETHRGSAVTDLVEGSNTAVTITLEPLAGDQPIVVVIGGITVEVTPAADIVAAGGTIQLTGVVLNEAGDTLEVSPVWATLSPANATVDSTGLVTGVSTGSATIVGTYGGVGAGAVVTVQAFPTDGLLAFLTFDGNLDDNSGAGRDFSNTGGEFVPDRTGTAGSAISFSTIGAAATRDWPDFPVDAFSIAFWAKIDVQALSVGYHLFSWGTAPVSPTPGVRLSLDENWQARGCPDSSSGYAIGARINFNDATLLGGEGCLPFSEINQWRHFVLTTEGGVARVYINGALDTVRWYPEGQLPGILDTSFLHSSPVIFDQTIAYLGVNSNSSNATTRIMDSFGVWNRALTPAEVALLAND